MAGKKGSKPYPFAVKLLAVHLFLDEATGILKLSRNLAYPVGIY